MGTGVAASARRILSGRGWRAVAIGNAPLFRHTSLVLYPKGRAALEGWRHEIAAALAPWFADLDTGEWAILERAVELMAARTATDAAVSA